ncbi:MAG: prepilin peptidase [Planctomycetota bacterium]|jgi:prepilin peptidase CpaA
MNDVSDVLQWLVVIAAASAAVVSDLRTRRIPNLLTLPVLSAGLIRAAWLDGLLGLGEATAACLVLALPYVLLFLFGGGGAGDAKLMGAVGAWLGLKQGITVLCCVTIAGLVLAIGKTIAKKRVRSVVTNIYVAVYSFLLVLVGKRRIQHIAGEPEGQQPYGLTIPYGVAIFAGVCAGGVIVWLW